MIKSLHKISVFCVMALPFAMTAPAHAAMVIDSSAYGLSSTLSAANTVLVNVGPLAATGGSAAPAYAHTAGLATINQNLSLAGFGLLSVREKLRTGVVHSTASSPFPVTPTGTASATINDLDVGLTTQALLAPLLSVLNVSADTIVSTSSVSAVGGLSAFGSSTIEGLDVGGLSLALGGLFLDSSLYVNPNANTVLVDLLGLRIVLNEQTHTGNGVSDIGIATNALRLTFDDFLLGGKLVSGDVIVGHSQASISGYTAPPPAVPEPTTWAMLITGFGLVGGAMRMRRQMLAMA